MRPNSRVKPQVADCRYPERRHLHHLLLDQGSVKKKSWKRTMQLLSQKRLAWRDGGHGYQQQPIGSRQLSGFIQGHESVGIKPENHPNSCFSISCPLPSKAVKNELLHCTTACNSYGGNKDHTKQLERQLPYSARQQMLLLAICAAMATEVLPVSAGLHLLLLRVRWDEKLPGTCRKLMRIAKPPRQCL